MSTNLMTRPVSLVEEFSAAHSAWSDERVIRAICDRMLDQAEVSPPVDVELLASVCGISEVEYRSEGPAGMLLCRGGRWVASVLGVDGLERRRFTVLHEGGHTFQPDFKRSGRYHRCEGPRSRQEQLCDVAAAEMLLPRRFFGGDLLDAGVDLDGVEELASTYVASLQATSHRVVDLAAVPVGMMVFHFAHKPDDRGREHLRDPKVRLEYAHTNGHLPFPLRHKSAAAGSPFHRAWEHELIEEVADVDDYFADPVGPVRLSARRYGDKVIGLARPRRKSGR